jgi:hypothetical protein
MALGNFDLVPKAVSRSSGESIFQGAPVIPQSYALNDDHRTALTDIQMGRCRRGGSFYCERFLAHAIRCPHRDS